MNPIKNATLSDDVALPIGNAINIIMDLMNAYTRQCALKYGYMFVDISDVETPSAATRMSIGQILSISDPIEYALVAHPTPRGYAQIAEKIISAVNKDLGISSDHSFNIKDFFTAVVDWFKSLFLKITDLIK